MNINKHVNRSVIKKQVFKCKTLRNDGLILQVHHTIEQNQKQQRIRFIHACFDASGHTLAAADFAGNIFIINFIISKFWVLAKANPCTVLKFSSYSDYEIIVGTTNGNLNILHVDTGEVTGELIGHSQPVTDVSFSHDYMCLSSTRGEAIVWDLRSNSKVQVLSLKLDCTLKHVLFMPVTSNVLACFEDDTVLIWKYGTFDICKQIQPTSWNKNILRSIAFTRNGRAMVFSGYSSQLTVFMLDTWTIAKTATLPDYIQSVKKIDFMPQLFDGGANKVLAILASHGVIYFYDIEQDAVINRIVPNEEIIRFDCSSDGKYITCVLRSGEVNIYAGGYYVPSHNSRGIFKKRKSSSVSGSLSLKRTSETLLCIQKQLKQVLDIDKLRSILQEFKEYPEAYRTKIWTQLLELPNNKEQYNNFINHLPQPSFESLTQEYPLENKLALKNLRQVLSNIVTWCPYFNQVSYLPVFVFPFVRVFTNEPVLCFEAICTIILNWCQHWFEYFPLPPVNILAMVENILLEHDCDLLRHLTANNIPSTLYAWSLLEVAFSEVLTAPEWCQLWDHILTNEPAFLLMCVAAYSILNRQTLLTIDSTTDFEFFYHNQNVINMKRLISKSYALLSNTSEKNHPRRYLNAFKKLEVGSYPTFVGFPKVMIDFECSEMNDLKRERDLIDKDSETMLRRREAEQKELEAMQLLEVENDRLIQLEEACRKRVEDESERVKEQRRRLTDLRQQLHQEELDVLNKSRERIVEKNTKQRQRALEKIISDVKQSRLAEEIEICKAETDLMKQYSELLHHKIQLEDALNTEQPVPGPSRDYQRLKKQQQKLADVVESIHNDSESVSQLKYLNIATGIAAMDDLIARIEMELAQQTAERYENVNKAHSSVKALQLEAETKKLEFEVSKLLDLLADLKSHETKDRLQELHESTINKGDLLNPQKSRYMRQQRSSEFKERISHIGSFGEDFGKLRKLIKKANDGYVPGPSSPCTEQEDSLPSEELAVISLSSS